MVVNLWPIIIGLLNVSQIRMGPAQLFFEHASLVYAFKGKDGVLSNLANEGLWFAGIQHGTRFFCRQFSVASEPVGAHWKQGFTIRSTVGLSGDLESWQWVIEVQAQGEPLLC